MKKLLAVSLLLAACGSKKEPPTVKIDPAAANALVPADLKAKFEFVEKSVEEERGRKSKTVYTMAAPKTWTAGDMKMFAKLRPPSEDGFGHFTEISVGSNCDGACEEKDWAKTSEKVEFKQFRDGKKIVKDEVGKTNHLMVVEDGDDTRVIYAWWVDGGDHYYSCRATLSKGFSDSSPDPRPAIGAFEQACKAVNVKQVD